jgi:hypothetical protein
VGFFEQYPWLLIPAIVVTVELWAALKGAVAHVLAARRNRPTARD